MHTECTLIAQKMDRYVSYAWLKRGKYMKKVTIQDIAKEMKLSRNTVAKALNGGQVSTETKMDVIKVAQQMGYTKLNDQLLEEFQQYSRKNYTGTILVLMQKWESAFLQNVVTGLTDGAMLEGFRIQLHIADEANLRPEVILGQLYEDVKGIIFLGVYPTSFVKQIASCRLPVTFFNTPVNAQDYIEIGDVYSLESFYSMNKMISYCIEIKHCQSFAFIGNAEGSRGVQARMLGFIGACNQHGIKISDKNLFTRPVNDKNFSYSEVKLVLEKMEAFPDAFICENDEVAKQVALWLFQQDEGHGLQYIITGFGNTIGKDFFRQDILTVEVRMEMLGKRLVKSIVDRVKDPEMDISFVTIATYPKVWL